MIGLLTISLCCSIVAFVYCEILIAEGHICHAVFKYLTYKLTKTIQVEMPDNTPEEVKQLPGYEHKPVYQLIQKKHFLLKPLGDCPYCTAGQLAVWVYAFKYILFLFMPVFISTILVTLSLWILFACSSIFFIHLLKKS